jgi:hypothetical protein
MVTDAPDRAAGALVEQCGRAVPVKVIDGGDRGLGHVVTNTAVASVPVMVGVADAATLTERH